VLPSATRPSPRETTSPGRAGPRAGWGQGGEGRRGRGLRWRRLQPGRCLLQWAPPCSVGLWPPPATQAPPPPPLTPEPGLTRGGALLRRRGQQDAAARLLLLLRDLDQHTVALGHHLSGSGGVRAASVRRGGRGGGSGRCRRRGAACAPRGRTAPPRRSHSLQPPARAFLGSRPRPWAGSPAGAGARGGVPRRPQIEASLGGPPRTFLNPAGTSMASARTATHRRRPAAARALLKGACIWKPPLSTRWGGKGWETARRAPQSVSIENECVRGEGGAQTLPPRCGAARRPVPRRPPPAPQGPRAAARPSPSLPGKTWHPRELRDYAGLL
jgi:hypothetical protein